MKQTINFSNFQDAFRIRPNNFTYKGLKALFEHLENYEEEIGEEMELDVIALCCDYTEYSDLEEFQKEHDKDFESIEDIEDKTTVIPFGTDSFIVQNF